LVRMEAADRAQGWGRLQHEAWWLNQRSGVNVSGPRNILVEKFLALPSEPDWLLMVDTDMVWQPSALESLILSAEEQPGAVIGGLCLTFGSDPNGIAKQPVVISTVYGQSDRMDGVPLPPFAIGRATDIPRSSLFEVY